MAAANTIVAKAERNAALDEATASISRPLADEFPDRDGEIKAAVRSLTKKLVRKRIVEEGLRIDGRTTAEIRPLSAEVDLFPTAHGSALFQRGETQVLNVTTLGMPRMNQLLDTITPDDHKRYMHHYNFPPFSTGETGFMRGPKRREIGHGLLAERALLPVVPYEEDFPYTLRLVSDVLASNGSTSMASVCGSTLSMMAAGVPLKAPVAGIAMGLVYDGGTYVTLTDILGAEDAFGDMDFKVAGTKDVVTALQLDTKIDGLPLDVLTKALLQAKDARLTILDVMAGAIAEPRHEVADSAPKIISFEIPMDKIGEVIGPKGKVINALQQETGADIAVDDDGMVGTVTIGAKDGTAVEEARRRIATILDPPLAEVGATYPGKVVNITKFGAFVNILPGATACSTSPRSARASGSSGSRTSSSWASRSRCGSTTSTPRARSRCRWPANPLRAPPSRESAAVAVTAADAATGVDVRTAVDAHGRPVVTTPTPATVPIGAGARPSRARPGRCGLLRGGLRGGAGPGVRRSGAGSGRVVRSSRWGWRRRPGWSPPPLTALVGRWGRLVPPAAARRSRLECRV